MFDIRRQTSFDFLPSAVPPEQQSREDFLALDSESRVSPCSSMFAGVIRQALQHRLGRGPKWPPRLSLIFLALFILWSLTAAMATPLGALISPEMLAVQDTHVQEVQRYDWGAPYTHAYAQALGELHDADDSANPWPIEHLNCLTMWQSRPLYLQITRCQWRHHCIGLLLMALQMISPRAWYTRPKKVGRSWRTLTCHLNRLSRGTGWC